MNLIEELKEKENSLKKKEKYNTSYSKVFNLLSNLPVYYFLFSRFFPNILTNLDPSKQKGEISGIIRKIDNAEISEFDNTNFNLSLENNILELKKDLKFENYDWNNIFLSLNREQFSSQFISSNWKEIYVVRSKNLTFFGKFRSLLINFNLINEDLFAPRIFILSDHLLKINEKILFSSFMEKENKIRENISNNNVFFCSINSIGIFNSSIFIKEESFLSSLKIFLIILFSLHFFNRTFSFFNEIFFSYLKGINSFSLFGKSISKKKSKKDKIKFNDIGGLENVKDELQYIILNFKKPELFKNKNIYIPKGILLVGPPGNGKTMIARALANECDVPFLFRSGSSFEEGIVGLGARRIRELFLEAKKKAISNKGCIIFIDEIDSIGAKRYSQKERVDFNVNTLTINELLSEMDGFISLDRNIFVIAATNADNVLDPALTRPGRFEKRIRLHLPNKKARKSIIEINIKKNSSVFDFNINELLPITKGLSSAQIVSLLNESLLLSLRKNKEKVDMELILESFDRIIFGIDSDKNFPTLHNLRLTAFHEAGHACIALTLGLKVTKITIIGRGSIGGYTWINFSSEEESDDYIVNKKQLLSRFMCALGGRESEEFFFGKENVTTGSQNDFKNASKIIDDYVLEYGMSKLGIFSNQNDYFNKSIWFERLSDNDKEKIEKERKRIFDKGLTKVKYIIRKKVEIIEKIVLYLLKNNTILESDLLFIFFNNKLPWINILF